MAWQPKENICWVGDSITAAGGFINYIWRYLLCKYPYKRLNFRNCGTPGDATQHVINRFEYDIMSKNPQQAVIMLGMNDTGGGIYNEKYAESTEHNDKVVADYKINILNLINMFEARSIELVLCTPTPFDDTMKSEAENFKGRNEVLGCFAQVIKDVANSKGIIVVDFWSEMTEYNQKFQRISPDFTLCGADRTHPEVIGHCMMAYIFLKTTGHLDDDFQINYSDEIMDAIQKKHLIESKLREMNMITRAMQEMGYDNNSFKQFKKAYIITITDKPWYEYCIRTLALYETHIAKEREMQLQVEDYISAVNNIV